MSNKVTIQAAALKTIWALLNSKEWSLEEATVIGMLGQEFKKALEEVAVEDQSSDEG